MRILERDNNLIFSNSNKDDKSLFIKFSHRSKHDIFLSSSRFISIDPSMILNKNTLLLFNFELEIKVLFIKH